MNTDLMLQHETHAIHATRRPGLPSFAAAAPAGHGVIHLVLGDDRHGVARLALQLIPARVLARRIVEPTLAEARRFAASIAPSAPIHVHLNDDLLGPDPIGFLDALGSSRPLALTLHDVPQPEEGRHRAERRAALYRALAARADLLIVLSRHELDGLRAIGIDRHVEVVNHPIDARRFKGGAFEPNTAGMIGWIHPGKGYEATLEAISELLQGWTLVALGAPAPGHRAFADGLQSRAEALGVGFEVTGYLSEDELLLRAGAIQIPVCAHRHVSASGSLGTWLRAGRVPLVTSGGYAREIAARSPRGVRLTDDLRLGIAAAAADPGLSVLDSTVGIGPSTAESSEAQSALLARWSAGQA